MAVPEQQPSLDISVQEIPDQPEISVEIGKATGMQSVPVAPQAVKGDHNQTIAKVNNYYFLAQSIKRSSEYEKAGINIKISDEIMNYLNKNYPKELSEVIGGQ